MRIGTDISNSPKHPHDYSGVFVLFDDLVNLPLNPHDYRHRLPRVPDRSVLELYGAVFWPDFTDGPLNVRPATWSSSGVNLDYWVLKCECGKFTFAKHWDTAPLACSKKCEKNPNHPQSKYFDGALWGNQFGVSTVIAGNGITKEEGAIFLMLCDCGSPYERRAASIVNGKASGYCGDKLRHLERGGSLLEKWHCGYSGGCTGNHGHSYRDISVEVCPNAAMQRRDTGIRLLGGECINCGSVEDLEFDHEYPEDKEYEIASLWSRSGGLDNEILQAELAKCNLRCKYCHRAKTAEEASQRKTADKDKLNALLNQYEGKAA